MDIVVRAQQRREQLKAELTRIESFLATAYELQQELAGGKAGEGISDAGKADLPVAAARASGSRGGTGAETLRVVADILTNRGQPLSTRELLPLVRAQGIDVGGKDPIATLSARISSKGIVSLTKGKWWLTKSLEETSADAGDEAADSPGKDQSAASLFSADKENDVMPPP